MMPFWAFILPIAAVWSTIEAVRLAPVALANVRTRRRFAPSTSECRPGRVLGRPTPSAMAGRRIRRIVEGRHRRVRDRAVPDRLDRVVRRLRSGATLTTAILEVGTGDDVFGELAADLSRGRPLGPSVARWRDADPAPNRRLAAIALELTADSGGASARVLDGVTDSLRDRVALEREVVALSSQSRASAVLLVLAPIVFAVLAGSIDGRILATLLGTPVGWACLLGGIGLDVVGAVWMARLVGRHR